MFNFNNKNKRTQAGFTILEALVATSILMVAVAAPITIAQRGLSSTIYAKNQMIASYLAQDAIEYIKNKRDEASINSLSLEGYRIFDWGTLSYFDKCKAEYPIDNTELGCQIDTINGEVSVFSANTFLKKGTGVRKGFYPYEEGDNTIFTRQIKLKINPYRSNPDEAMITVTVNWGSVENSVTVNTLIYNI